MNNKKIDKDKIISDIISLLEIKKKKKITSNYNFKELDSLNKLKLMGYMSENFNISINMDKLEKIKSIEDILKIIKKN
jgi:acyl carrier protein